MSDDSKLVEALARAMALKIADADEEADYHTLARACLPIIQSLSAHPAGDVALHRYRHNTRGTEYDLICVAKLQDATGKGVNEGAHLCVYRGDDGYHWAREVGEFIDGRFTRIPFLATPAAPTTDAGALVEEPVDGGMDGETVAAAEWAWANLPVGPRKWTSLATHEKALVCHVVEALKQPSNSQSGYLTAYVSLGGNTVSIDHETDADWHKVRRAHEILRDRLNERLGYQDKCPVKPAALRASTGTPAEGEGV